MLRGSLQLRHVDAGSCNGCELEIASSFSPVYDGERYGLRLVASPRHADGLLVTGPVTRNMVVPLRKTLEATLRRSSSRSVMAALAGALLPRRARVWASGLLSAPTAVGGGVAAVATLAGGDRAVAHLPHVPPLAGIRVELDPLGAVFVAATALVALPASLFGLGYARHGLEGRTVQGTFPLFVLSLLLVPAAASVSTLLVLWELMALTSLVLWSWPSTVIGRRSPARDSGTGP